MKNLLESFCFVSLVLLVFILAQVSDDIIPSQDQKDAIYGALACVTASFLGLLIRAYCFKVGGITFARFGRLFCSFGISK